MKNQSKDKTASDAPSPGRDYAAVIGGRVRAIRARRGMPRKQLSAESGISERYLAQIETGKANISIELLQRLAQAMVVPIHGLLPDPAQQALPSPLRDLLQRLSPAQLEEAQRLLAEHFAPRRPCQSGIALIGIRCSGKTTFGERLANQYGLPFIRLREVIEQRGGMRIGEILEMGGQRTYRRLEHEALEQVIHEHPRSVLETGGGLVTEPETFQHLLDHFYTVWLRAEPAELMRRLMAVGDMRPLEGNNYDMALEDLTRILTERDEEYRQADLTLDTTGRSVDDCFHELAAASRFLLDGTTAKSSA